MSTAAVLIWLVQAWLYVGTAVAVAFVLFGIDRVEENARGAYTFRPLLIPGIVLLWPLVVWRWLRLETGQPAWQARYRPLVGAHRPVWVVLAVVIPVVFIAALLSRQPRPVDVAPVELQQISR